MAGSCGSSNFKQCQLFWKMLARWYSFQLFTDSFWSFVSWENLSCQIVINNVNVFKMILYLKNVLFPKLIHTRFLSVQFNKKASFFQRKFSFLYYKNFKYWFGHKRENPKILVWRKCFRGFICCKFIESIVANLPRTLLKTCSAIWDGKIPHKQGELPKHTQQADG